MESRLSGILLHITSLPGPFGIGDLGPSAYDFVNFLSRSGQRLWSILPVNEILVHEDACPYCPASAFAGNPLLISPEALVKSGLLKADDLESYPQVRDGFVEIEKVIEGKSTLLRKAFANFCYSAGDEDRRAFECFKNGTDWLPEYVHYAQQRAITFDVYQKKPELGSKPQEKPFAEDDFVSFTQYIFFQQWKVLREYANAQGIFLAGDISFYVSLDSSDVRGQPHLFGIDPATGMMTTESGAPPDEFQRKGQFWRTPIYNWPVHAEDGFKWWRMRIAANTRLYDTFRLDHFRGFESFWSIPTGSNSPKDGHFMKGPGKPFLDAIKECAGDAQMFVEDLGFITEEVNALREMSDLPGMSVLQLAFNGPGVHPYLPYNCIPDCVMYTSTHDLSPMSGWYNDLDGKKKTKVQDYVGVPITHENVHWEFNRLALASVAKWVLIPVQDLLGLGGEARLNIPGMRSENHILWRLSNMKGLEEIGQPLVKLTKTYGRWSECGLEATGI